MRSGTSSHRMEGPLPRIGLGNGDPPQSPVSGLGYLHDQCYQRRNGQSAEKEDCDEYLEDVYDRLFLMGLDLYPRNNPDDIEEQLPQGHLTGDENRGLFSVKPKFLNLYNSLVDEIMKINSDITATAMKVYIKFMLGKRHLLSIDCNNSAIIVYFCAKSGQLEDPKNVLRDVSSVGHHGRGDLRFDLNDAEQIPVVCEFVNQVINL